MKRIKVDLQLWRSYGYVYVQCTFEEFKQDVLRKFNYDIALIREGDGNESGGCLCEGDNYQPWFMWLAENSGIGELTHESLHATAGVLQSRGLELNPGSEEAFTYTLTSIVEQVYSAVVTKEGKRAKRKSK